MAGLLNANLPSSDEEDDDYNPLADDTAEREDRPAQAQQPKRRSNKRRRGAVAVEEDAGGDDDGEGEAMEEDGDDGADAEADANDPRTLARREKVSNLWEAINARAAANGSATERPPSSSTLLAALCHSTSGLGPKRAKKASADEIWMRSLGLLPKGGSAAAAKKPPASKPQATADAVLAAAAAAGGGSVSAQANGQKAAAAAADEASGPGGKGAARRGASPGSGEGGEEAEGRRAIAAAALAAARDAVAVGGRINKVVVKEVRRFAGKDVEVIMHVDKDSKEAQRAAAKEAAKAAAPLAASAGGLDAVLSEFEKKKKVTVLDKTRADWSEYKATNTEVEEELELHKRSGGQFLEKQNFLKRAELREYEKERDTRLASDVRTRGRL